MELTFGLIQIAVAIIERSVELVVTTYIIIGVFLLIGSIAWGIYDRIAGGKEE